MITKSQAKRKQDIKTKLMAAIAMLLVSSIMMVSSTYAWFTLSTAPEVTGITTAVGANGNLEMALLPKDGNVDSITSQAGDGAVTKPIVEKNVTWGNLVDLSDDTVYGLDKITLYPAELNIENNTIQATMLKTPKYGADGRVDTVDANTTTSYYDGTGFNPNENKGVRAIGTASGMTDRELSYRNARSSASTAKSLAATLASRSLNSNGSALANIAIAYGMNGAEAKFNKDDILALNTIITDLNTGILPQIERAYMQYILAYAASGSGNDEAWLGVKGIVEADGATLDSVIAKLQEKGVTTLPDGLSDAIADYKNMVTSVTNAKAKIDPLVAEVNADETKTFTWTEIRDAMTPLANPSEMLVNGIKAGEVKDNLGALVSSVTAQNGLKVIMYTANHSTTKTSAGVYADIADHCGDYTASITIKKVEYNGIVLENMSARMETDSALAPNYYLDIIGSKITEAGAPPRADGQQMPITDMYGYVIDLAFRTNATDSKLLMQREAVDRIYDGNTNEQTMGHGSSMTFQATTTDFSNDQLKNLMGAIRIVFFDTLTGSVHCFGKLDVANATSGTDGWTAEIVTYKNVVAGTDTYVSATYAADSGKTYYTKTTQDVYQETQYADGAPGTFFTKEADGTTYTEVATEDLVVGNTYFIKNGTKDVYTSVSDAEAAAAAAGTLYVIDNSGSTGDVIMSLPQNEAVALSVLVYLDGTVVTNAHVAATGSTSMTGSMNLQFASSANLVPMDYAALNIPAANNAGDGANAGA